MAGVARMIQFLSVTPDLIHTSTGLSVEVDDPYQPNRSYDVKLCTGCGALVLPEFELQTMQYATHEDMCPGTGKL